MSRALDKTVKEAVKKGDHAKVYEDLSALLTTPGPAKPLQIEILGSTHPLEDGVNYLKDEEDDKFVAIPKLRIVQAFIVARQLLLKSLEETNRKRSPPRIGDMKPTAVMLLMDPEHLTAANTRKRIIKHSIAVEDASHVKNLLQAELCLLRSLLTSHLHRHTKSPTLWSHRRWVIDQVRTFDPSLQNPLVVDMVDEIFISAERHPRNYYAWTHARYLVEANQGPCDVPGLVNVVEGTKKWCFKHHDDVSGWMYLLFVMGKLQTERKGLGQESLTEDVFHQTITLAKSFRWRNESVWYFLRNLVSSGLVGSREKDVFNNVMRDLEKGASSLDRVILNRTGTWVEQWSG